ncbi:class I SAM-dependent methyltransferase [Bermanella sp. R86510]|uniref:class I SAM-dependent methyltransferase n=1 Tax=unclassified Bermanella TaxID=2627862 RepID=UPI0037CB9664
MTSSVAQIEIKKSRFPMLRKLARKLVFAQLNKLHTGSLVINEGDQSFHFGETLDPSHELYAQLDIQDQGAYVDILTGGSIGAAEAYMTGDWTSPDLTKAVRVMARNIDLLNAMEGGIASLVSGPFLKFFHYLNQNSEKGSRRNIVAHYDLGNELFELFLDPTMMYSSGIFPAENASMEDASLNKLKTICERLQLSDQDHVVEIGTGWGGFAIYAAQNYGCRVTTTTISDEQYNLAQQRVKDAELEDKITLLKQDYRKLDGQYDKLVSIEMIEAVGAKYFDTFFEKCSSLLKDNGLMLIQAITIEDQRFDRALKNVDFIQRYIFPGSCIPSIQAMLTATKKVTNLNLLASHDFGLHYSRTLKLWQEAFNKQDDTVSKLGYSEDFKRMWRFYLSYCEGGFAERAIGVSHLVWAKPGYRPALQDTY